MNDILKKIESNSIILIFIFSFILIHTILFDTEKIKILCDNDTIYTKFILIYPLLIFIFYFNLSLIYMKTITEEALQKNKKIKYFIFVFMFLISLISYMTIYEDKKLLTVFTHFINIILVLVYIYYNFKSFQFNYIYLFIYPILMNLSYIILNLRIANN